MHNAVVWALPSDLTIKVVCWFVICVGARFFRNSIDACSIVFLSIERQHCQLRHASSDVVAILSCLCFLDFV